VTDTKEKSVSLSIASALERSLVLPGVASGDLPDVFLGNFLGFLKFGKDGEFRANQRAQTAVHAVFRMKHQFGWMITLDVEPFTFLEAGVGAKLDTEAAALASGFNNPHLAHRDGMGLRIKGQTPELHVIISTWTDSQPY
jgi:hypothetical protein